mgnify:CR=1 FL=1
MVTSTAAAGIELVCNNPTDTIQFEFDAEWANYSAKTARFSWEGKYIDVPFSGNIVQIPEIYQTNYVYIGVFAENLATTPAKIPCRYSIKCMGGNVASPTPDVYAQIIELINSSGLVGPPGTSVKDAIINADGHLMFTMTDNTIIDSGSVKFTDYWTESDKQEIVNDVLTAFIDASEVAM